MVAPFEPRGIESRRRETRSPPRGRTAIERSPSGDDERADHAVPALDRADYLDTRSFEPGEGEATRLVVSALADEASARAPSAAAQAATLAAWPPGAERGSPRPCRLPTASGLGSRTITSSVRSPKAQTTTCRIVRSVHGRRRATRLVPHLRPRQRRRRLRSACRRARRRRVQRRRGRPRGLAAFESAPCYLELIDAEREQSAVQDVALAFSAGADLRVPLPERAHVRGLPEDDRSGARRVV